MGTEDSESSEMPEMRKIFAEGGEPMSGDGGVRRYALKNKRNAPANLKEFFAGEGNGGEPRAPKSDFEASGSWDSPPPRVNFSRRGESPKKEGAKR
jgi:hypothetical protein